MCACPHPSRPPPNGTALHVLVVDDDPDIAHLLSRYLGSQGLRVTVAASARAARDAVLAQSFDVMLLDLTLPDEDGLTLMRDLRKHWQGPVIIVSGRGESVERVVGLELGADDFVTKPFDFRELLARIRSVVRRAQPPQAPRATGRGFEFEGFRMELASRRVLDAGRRRSPAHHGRVRPAARPRATAASGADARPVDERRAWPRCGPVRSRHRRADRALAPEAGNRPRRRRD
jgi:CheY-like chemotaxis protein